MSTVPQAPGGTIPAPPPQTSSGNKVLFWILGIVLGLILLAAGSCAVIGFYAMHKAGFNSELAKKNPGLAAAKMAVAMNPDVEIVSSDDSEGTITVRDKKTGKVATMKFDPQQKQMIITDEKGQTTTLSTPGEGSTGTMDVKGPEGTVKFGSGAEKSPAWVPVYPGASPQNTFSASKPGEESGSCTFTTGDSTEKVISYYSGALKSGGFSVSTTTTDNQGKPGGMVTGEDKAGKRAVMVMLDTESDGTHVNLTYSAKP
jgi:hypothetical protein